ncbi:MAG: fructose-bisphosphatase class III [Clostridia bacterium]|nr:fructose-bisphosphatase class III [Clostridia bacterium]
MESLRNPNPAAVTEHFVSDIHGEHEAFIHILRSASGEIRRKIDSTLGAMPEDDRRELASLICYPEEKLAFVKSKNTDMNPWYSKVIADLTCIYHAFSKQFVGTITFDKADEFIVTLSKKIQRFAIEHLHVVGDIYDRGPRADIIMDELCSFHSVDIQWGNHDIVWMGAAAGSEICVANALRIALRYNGFDMFELGYGIDLKDLADFADRTYNDDGFNKFKPSSDYDITGTPVDPYLTAKMHKAVSIIQFKLEGQLAMRNPSLALDHRRLLERINFDDYTIDIDGVIHPLLSRDFPTVDPKNPYELSAEEDALIKKFTAEFRNNALVKKHIDLLFQKGSVYLAYNGNLLFHGCVPLTEDGEIASVELFGKTMKGKEYFDFCDEMTRKAYFLDDADADKQNALDFIWYLWCGEKSPLFGKSRMTTFERYYVEDKATHEEVKNPYFKLLDRVDVAEKILTEFGLDAKTGHIINGHVPVKVVKKGENPVKAQGKLIVIDGGIAKPYQKETGLAGFALVKDPKALTLYAHRNPITTKGAIEENLDFNSTKEFVDEAK